MLSNMLRPHPDLLSISEFITSLSSWAFRGQELDGEALFRRLNTLSPGGRALLTNGFKMEEFLYEFGPQSRYRPDNLPPILCATLPHLSDTPDQLWDELAVEVRARPKATVAEQYRFVFDWLTRRFQKKIWLERSGSSLMFVNILAQWYPDARFVHIHRNGPDNVLSMARHPFFRLRVEVADKLGKVGLDPFSPLHTPGLSPYMPLLETVRFRFFNAERFRRGETDLASFGRYWSKLILRGVEDLARLPKERVLTMRYEDLLQTPREELTRLIDFIGPEYQDAKWLEGAAGLPRSNPSAFLKLSPEEQTRLTEACRPGQERLDAIGRS